MQGEAPGAVGATSGAGLRAGGTDQFGGSSGGTTSGPSGQAAGVGRPHLPDLRIGYIVKNLAGAASAFGGAGFNSDESTIAQQELMKGLIRYANETGGVGGRKLVGYEQTETTTDGLNQSGRTALCVKATEDQKVDVMISSDAFFSETDFACFAHHRTPLVTLMHTPSRQQVESSRPYLATTIALPDRAEGALVAGLDRVSWFRGAKIGAIVDDEPVIRAIYEHVVVPQLARLGVKVESAHYFAPTDPGQQSAEASSAVLDFRSRGVNKVLFLSNILGLIAFGNSEQSQRYHADLALGDYQIVASAGAGSAPTIASVGEAMKGAVAVSVFRGQIKDNPATSGTKISRDPRVIGPGLKRCLDVLSKETKKDYYTISPSARGQGWNFMCDSFFLWLQTARRTGAAVTPRNWGLALPGIASSFDSAVVHTTTFGPTSFDGAADYRIGRFYEENPDCGCYKALVPDYLPLPLPS